MTSFLVAILNNVSCQRIIKLNQLGSFVAHSSSTPLIELVTMLNYEIRLKIQLFRFWRPSWMLLQLLLLLILLLLLLLFISIIITHRVQLL